MKCLRNELPSTSRGQTKWDALSPNWCADQLILTSYLIPFSKLCLGYNLGYTTLLFAIATVTARYDMGLFETCF